MFCILCWVDNFKYKIFVFRVFKLLFGIGLKIVERVFNDLEKYDFVLGKLCSFVFLEFVKFLFFFFVDLLDNVYYNNILWIE